MKPRTAARLSSPLLALALVLAPGLALAHYPWITPADYAPVPGELLQFGVGFGHHFPGTDTLAVERIESVVLMDAAGEAGTIELGSGPSFQAGPLPGDGPWILGAQQTPAYYSRTPRGGQRSSRLENPDALSCSRSSNAAKALLGRGADAPDTPLGHALEIVPLAGEAAAGAPFAVRVLLHGEPWAGVVDAVYDGFEGAEDEYPLNAPVDEDGVARLEFDRAGRWLVKAQASEAYPEPAVCDRSNYNATLTLMVR
jgi:uncharacterized GH25 family protein